MLLMGLMVSTSLQSDSFKAFQSQQENGFIKEQQRFESFKQSQDEAFKKYIEEVNKVYKEFRTEVGAYWDEPKMPTKKEWVSYAKDKKTRTAVDFEDQVITIETIAKNEAEAKKSLEAALAKIVTIDVRAAQISDPFQQKIEKIDNKYGAVQSKSVKKEPLLSETIFNQAPSREQVDRYVQQHVKSDYIAVDKSKIKSAKVYRVTVKLPSNTMQRRSKQYLDDVKKNAGRFDIPMPLIFAVMHTESSFNPMAKSHIPADGLMQIVPTSAGVDTYHFLHKVKRQPSSTYLYNSQKNIEMGSAYLHILYYRYLRHVKNPTSRLYCAIAAYNTGAGNVAYAWTGNYNIKRASLKINNLTPDQVYNHLLRHLKYDEPKHYLKRVNARMDQYHKLYGDI